MHLRKLGTVRGIDLVGTVDTYRCSNGKCDVGLYEKCNEHNLPTINAIASRCIDTNKELREADEYYANMRAFNHHDLLAKMNRLTDRDLDNNTYNCIVASIAEQAGMLKDLEKKHEEAMRAIIGKHNWKVSIIKSNEERLAPVS